MGPRVMEPPCCSPSSDIPRSSSRRASPRASLALFAAPLVRLAPISADWCSGSGLFGEIGEVSLQYLASLFCICIGYSEICAPLQKFLSGSVS